MSKRKAKNKLKNNNNVKINGKNKPKNTTNLAQNSEFKVINSQPNNEKCPRPTTTPTNSEITHSITRKISIISKKTKLWIQSETKNVLESIETTKKRLVKEILWSTKSICTKILETIDLTLDPAKISNFKCNSIAAIQDHEINNNLTKITKNKNINKQIDNYVKYETPKISIHRALRTSTKYLSPIETKRPNGKLTMIDTSILLDDEEDEQIENKNNNEQDNTKIINNDGCLERYRNGIQIEGNYNITFDTALLGESQSTINMSKMNEQIYLQANQTQNQSNEVHTENHTKNETKHDEIDEDHNENDDSIVIYDPVLYNSDESMYSEDNW